ncbi:hypothetical protein GCK72_003506 [Caenorhabditis remanei]|uniref:Uncharacterized protein n=1 Tax=Caenorhabditis remanei TaxID=31234 RepID=A0A6A5HV35_CAERE|nr:hypothetical protein GCK72_003506 [Caenorhabditis remanei]KAF1771679.1 hypothetical protein GCK72_003506 [Caenorhabditis remanei]
MSTTIFGYLTSIWFISFGKAEILWSIICVVVYTLCLLHVLTVVVVFFCLKSHYFELAEGLRHLKVQKNNILEEYGNYKINKNKFFESEDSDMNTNCFKRNYELEEKHLLWNLPFIVINPIYAVLNRGTSYTSVYKQSPLIHFCFWHFYIFSTFVLPTTFYPPPVKDNMPWFFANVYNVLSFYITADFLLSKKMPIIQQIRDVQAGCVGSLLSTWCMMFAYVTVDLDGYFVVSFDIYRSYTDTKLSL